MIIDCFPFFNELDLLELRLNELKDVVDLFVLSEATMTFTNKPKPLVFDENKDLFYKYPIEHVIMDKYDGIKVNEPWPMGYAQKQFGLDAALKICDKNGGGLILLNDADEISRADKVKEVIDEGWTRVTAEMVLHYHYLNCKSQRPWRHATWFKPKGTSYVHKNVRGGRYKDSQKIIESAGWHFSYLGSAQDVLYKIDSFEHQEKNIPPYNTVEHIMQRRESGRDIYDRRRIKFEFTDDLEYLPKYVLENMKKYSKYIRQENVK